jgi:hypothetical protein
VVRAGSHTGHFRRCTANARADTTDLPLSASNPIMRFVVGAWYSAPAVARQVAGRRQPPPSFAF